MELRVHNNIEAIKTPIGFFPRYQDLKKLFKEVLNKDYSEEDYHRQFTLRIPENLVKIERIVEIYKAKAADFPDIFFKLLQEQKQRLEKTKVQYGDYVASTLF